MGKKNVSTDHLGQEFPSIVAMCAHWGVDSTTFRYRLKHGKTLEQALTEERGNGNSKPCADHLGQEFPSIVAMCAHWDVKLTTYNTRIESGRTVEVALTGEWERGFSHSKPCTDHLGNDFPSQRAMCEHWGVDPGEFSRRRASGKTVEEALTAVNAKCKPCTDHLGNDFPSQRAMCAHWGVDSTTFRYRLKHGKTLEQALTEERGNGNGKPCADHLGQEFPSIVAMCKHWGVNPGTFNVRIKSGRTLEQALTGIRGEKG